MENFLSSRKVVWLFAVIGVIAIAAVGIAYMYSRNKVAPQAQQPSNTQAQITKRDIPTSQLPDKFPSDIPQEAGARITQNDVQTTTDGRFQASRSFVTAKTLDENLKIYQTYFQSNGWATSITLNGPTYKALTATKGDLSVQVSLNDNTATQQKTVDIYLVQKVKTN